MRERHSDAHDVINDVVALDANEPSDPVVVFGGRDFVMSPRFVSDDRLRLIAWDHPNMPWNDTMLVECDFDPATGRSGAAHVLASGASFMQPVGDTVISDRDGYWNLWRVDAEGETQLTTDASEVGGPAWVFGLRDHGVLADGRRVWRTGGTLHVADSSFDTGAADLEQLVVGEGTITCIVRSDERPATIVRFDAGDPTRSTTIVDHPPLPIDTNLVSRPRRIEFATAGENLAYGWFYEPVNNAVDGPADDAPPLLVMIHGGPTTAARPWFSLAYQFWTSRGFAIIDVDHRGSTGYGTEYRNLLDGEWGIADVEDCIAAATHLADAGLVDRSHMAIRGGSAGGFTVLSALVQGDVFAAGACSFGIADLSVLAADTHKFEARYLDRLVGPWPQAREVYDERSPINHLDQFDTPLIIFQGLDDRVVPPSQSEMVVDAFARQGHRVRVPRLRGRRARVPSCRNDRPASELRTRLLPSCPRLSADATTLRRASPGRDTSELLEAHAVALGTSEQLDRRQTGVCGDDHTSGDESVGDRGRERGSGGRRGGSDQLGDAGHEHLPTPGGVGTSQLDPQRADATFGVRWTQHRQPRREAVAPSSRASKAEPGDVGEGLMEHDGRGHPRQIAILRADRLGEPAQLPPASPDVIGPAAVAPGRRQPAERTVVGAGARRPGGAVDRDVDLIDHGQLGGQVTGDQARQTG